MGGGGVSEQWGLGRPTRFQPRRWVMMLVEVPPMAGGRVPFFSCHPLPSYPPSSPYPSVPAAPCSPRCSLTLPSRPLHPRPCVPPAFTTLLDLASVADLSHASVT